jgi:hypothetical protein
VLTTCEDQVRNCVWVTAQILLLWTYGTRDRYTPAMRKVWEGIRYLFGFAEKLHTAIWLAEILGIATLLAGIGASVARHPHRDVNGFTIIALLVVGAALLVLPRGIYAFYRQTKQPLLPTEENEKTGARRSEQVKIHTIDFGYMKNSQESPLNNGWRWAEKDESTGVVFRIPHDAPTAGSLVIIPFVSYGIDFVLQQNWILTDRLEYSAKYEDSNAAFYTRVKVGFKDTRKDELIWIAHKVGNARPEPDGNSKNWVVFHRGNPLSNGWRSFDVSVADEVRRIYENQGGFLRHLTELRLREALSISPIDLYETGHRAPVAR